MLNLFNFSNTLNDIKAKVLECTKCPYHQLKHNIGHRVCGTGTCDNGLVVIGQCPGERELEDGTPFTGRSGSILKGMMRDAGIIVKDSYLTNIIRCAPPSGKNIIAPAIKQCMTWLEDELVLIKPKLIVCLGIVAGKALLKCDSMADSGKWKQTVYNIPGMLTYHTAYLMRLRSGEYADEEKYKEVQDAATSHWRTIGEIINAG